MEKSGHTLEKSVTLNNIEKLLSSEGFNNDKENFCKDNNAIIS